MNFNFNYITYVICFITLIALRNPSLTFAQKPFADFLNMKGDLVKHSYTDIKYPSSDQRIIELRNEKSLPVWFAQDVHKVVCLTGDCRKVDLWIFWDGIGDYLGFQLYDNEPLTKTDHVNFDQKDYEKLHRLLADTGSVLKRIKQEELIIKTYNKDDRMDGYSGATQPSLQEYLVKDAAYTCHTLWHIVYGPIQAKILRILGEKANDSYLKLLFDQNESKYKSWAISFIQRNPAYHSTFVQQIIDQIKSDNDHLSLQAMNYFGSDQLYKSEIQKKLASMIDELPDQRRYELLWKLDDLIQIKDETILILLEKFNQNKIKVYLLGDIYNLIHSENLKNQLIEESLKTFLGHENLYVRNLTDKLLAELSFIVK